jgi:hypothetical protein
MQLYRALAQRLARVAGSAAEAGATAGSAAR